MRTGRSLTVAVLINHAELPTVIIDLDLVQTNIILFQLTGEHQVDPFLSALRKKGVLMLSLGGGRIRIDI